MQKECIETKLRFKISKKVCLLASPIMLRPLKTLTQYLIGLEHVGILVLEWLNQSLEPDENRDLSTAMLFIL